jgi:hypothetical protein
VFAFWEELQPEKEKISINQQFNQYSLGIFNV